MRLFVPLKKKSMVGKVVLVTGAGHGIGRELAIKFSDIGARLVLWDINKVHVCPNKIMPYNIHRYVAEKVNGPGSSFRAP